MEHSCYQFVFCVQVSLEWEVLHHRDGGETVHMKAMLGTGH